MKLYLPALFFLFMSGCTSNSTDSLGAEDVKSRYKVGQVWAFKSRPSEPNAKLTIVKIEPDGKLGNIIHVYVDSVKIKTSAKPVKYSHVVSHMPFSEAAIDSSVTKKIGEVTNLPNFQEGYNEWHTSFKASNAGVFSIPVEKSIEYMETTMLKGNVVK
ncbi:MAG: hypothetical protein EOO61_22705 [Hymenobacter sp.]|nr:MAG: hypothetical protein EOO61_22705 [Hymenobacter sp.]